MPRYTEHTRKGGTHYVEPKKPRKGRDAGVTETTEEDRSDADETKRHRGEG